MNANHSRLCPSPEWADYLQSEVLPRLCDGLTLGPDLLELGPGPGAATAWLHPRVERLVAVELDPDAAQLLRDRFAGTNVTVDVGDATALPYPDASFDTVAAFTMLHHVPTQSAQNAVFAQVLRVLRPGGVFVASDSRPGTSLHDFHADDVYNPIDPATLIARLQTVGFDQLTVDVRDRWTVSATKAS